MQFTAHKYQLLLKINATSLLFTATKTCPSYQVLCTFHLNNKEIHLGFIEYKASVGNSNSNKFNKLLVAVNS